MVTTVFLMYIWVTLECNRHAVTEHTKNDKFSYKQHTSTVLWINNVGQYFIYTERLKCSKCHPCACTHSLSRCLHWLTAESMTVCCRSSHTHTSTKGCFSSSTLLKWHPRCCMTPKILQSIGFKSELFDGQRSGPSLTTEYAKNDCNWTQIAQVIVEHVVTSFFSDTV